MGYTFTQSKINVSNPSFCRSIKNCFYLLHCRCYEVLLPAPTLAIRSESLHEVCPDSEQRYNISSGGESSGKIQVLKTTF